MSEARYVVKKLSPSEQLVLEKLMDVRLLLRQDKPGDRTDRDRHFAICITELEKFEALYRGLIVHEEEIINE